MKGILVLVLFGALNSVGHAAGVNDEMALEHTVIGAKSEAKGMERFVADCKILVGDLQAQGLNAKFVGLNRVRVGRQPATGNFVIVGECVMAKVENN